MNNEPVITAATVTGIVSAGLVMLISLNMLTLSDTQQAAVMGFITLIVPVIIAFWPRSKVTPVENPKVTTESGQTVRLVRADGKPLPGQLV